jgi:lipooligosaccharide transport system permease protein
VITPMMLVCGVFFPIDQLPPALQAVAAVLPLTHAVAIARPLMNDAVPAGLLTHLAVLVAYGLVGFQVALAMTRRRLLK